MKEKSHSTESALSPFCLLIFALCLLPFRILAGPAFLPATADQKAKPAAAAPQAAGTAKFWKQLTFPKLGEVKLPEVKRYTLANGMKLFLVEDHRLPLVDGTALVRTGARWEPVEKTGLASIFGQVLRTGGTRTKPGDQIDEELEAIAASVESSVGTTSGSVSFSSLKEDQDKVLGIFADVLMNPEFRQEKIDLAKTFARNAISRRNDDVSAIASREFRKLLYGASSPYARQTEYYTIDAITRADLVTFYQQYYHPNNIMLGVWGDLQPEELKDKMEKLFASWKPAELRLPPVPAADAVTKASLNLVRKEDVNQTHILVGQLAGRLDDPDYFALDVMAEILCAGDFSSRVTKHIRTEMGLAYAAGGQWSPNYDYPGVFAIRVDTKSETTARATEAVLKEVREIREKEVSDEELRVAKESILNAFVFNFQSVGRILQRLMTYEYYGYAPDFLEKYKANVEKVTKADALRVVRKHVDPDNLVILAAGRDKEFDKPLTQLAPPGGTGGKVNLVDITIPESRPAPALGAGPSGPGPGPAAAGSPAKALDPAALERGRAILARAQKFAGGLERLRAIQDIETTAQATAITPQGPLELSIHSVTILPHVSRSDVVLPFGNMATFFDGANGWAQQLGPVQEMTETQKQDARGQLFRSLQNLLRDEDNAVVAFDKRDGASDVLLVSRGDLATRLYVEETGKVVKQVYQGTTFAGPGEVEQTYSDYREVAGIELPHKLVTSLNGQKILEGEIGEVKINTGADPAKLAEKPQ